MEYTFLHKVEIWQMSSFVIHKYDLDFSNHSLCQYDRTDAYKLAANKEI